MIKLCRRCKSNKPIAEFGTKSSSPDGHSVYCKECMRFYRAAYNAANPEKVAKQQNEWRIVCGWNQTAATHDWRKRNPGKVAFYSSLRRATKLQATPAWANLVAIKSFYENCPKGMHVDHIVPLRSPIVCGLHCEANLQYSHPLENQSKNNKCWPSMTNDEVRKATVFYKSAGLKLPV